MRKLVLAILALMALASAMAQDFIINNGTEPQSLDPALIQGEPEHRIYTSLFEGLVINDPKTSRAVPGVAEKWSISPDGLTITFTLRKDATWSDGVKITAKDFVDSWLRTLDPATGSQYAYMMGLVVKGADEYNSGKGPREGVAIKAPDDRTFVVTLRAPAPFAVDMMAHYAFSPVPMHAVAKYGADWIKAGKFVGNGPFVLKEWAPQDHITVVKNPKYWDAKNVKLKSITFLPIEDNKIAYNKYKNGEIDWATSVPLDLLDEVMLRKDYQVAPQVGTYYFIFNTTRKPLDDVRVRKALAMAIDKQQLVSKITRGGQVVADSLVPPMPPYVPAKGNAFNVEQARKLLADAGFPGGKGFPKMTVIYNTSDNHKKICEYVQAQWKQNLGIDIALQNIEWKTFLDVRSVAHDFDISRAGWISDYLDPQTYLDMFEKDSGNNDGLYDNPKYDALVKGDLLLKSPAREKQMREAEEILVTQDQAILPIYFYVSQALIDTSKWGGWYSNPLDSHEWKFIYRK